MQSLDIFSSKAEKYARFRWDYAPQAVQRIFELTGMNEGSVIADIGAGTGILTRHWVGKCKLVYAIEPSASMRALAAQSLGDRTGWQALDGRAEATGLPSHSLDMISVAQALSWFDPLPARQEFRRILKASGWLAVIRNSGSYGSGLDAAFKRDLSQRNGHPALDERPGHAAELLFWQPGFLAGEFRL